MSNALRPGSGSTEINADSASMIAGHKGRHHIFPDVVPLRVMRNVLGIVICLLVMPVTVPPAMGQTTSLPDLILIDSLVLIETSNQFVGRLTGFIASKRGNYYLTDASTSTVLEYTRTGRLARQFSARGQGPGELTRPTDLGLIGDTTLLILDGPTLHAFDLRSGRSAWDRKLPKLFLGGGLATFGKGIGLPALDSRRQLSLIFFNGRSDSVRAGGPFPAPYGRSAPVDGTFGSAIRAAHLRGDTLVTAFHASDYIYLGTPFGGRYDSLKVARRIRNGAPPEKIAAASRDSKTLQETAYALSAPWAIAPLSGDRIAHVSVDQRLLSGRLAGKLFVSVVDRGTRRTCPDAPIPIDDDPPGYVAFLGDTLIVAHQEETAQQVPRTILRRYLIDTSKCRWIP